jgi:hypothetical protein
MDKKQNETGNSLVSSWATLYKAGAIAPLISISIYMIQLLVINWGSVS